MVKQKKENKKAPNRFKVNEVLGVSEKRADELIELFHKALHKHSTWTEVLEYVKKSSDIKGEGDFAYMGYMFGRLYERHDGRSKNILTTILGGILKI